MTVQTARSVRPFAPPPTFAAWRDQFRGAALSVIAVAGSRGKTTVVRLLDAIFRAADLRTAIWTDHGVEIEGRRQGGELRPWSRALARLGDGTLDVAVQELDWSTVHAVGLPTGVYPVLAVTNVCANNDACLAHPDSRRALGSLDAVFAAVRPDGTLVLNGDDYAVGDAEVDHRAATILVAQRADGPLVRAHLADGGTAAWTDANLLRVGSVSRATELGAPRELAFALGGAASFEVQNALTASAIAVACGVPTQAIRSALQRFAIFGWLMPGSFNSLRVGETIALVDRPAPPWFLRPSLRVASHLPHERLLVVAGRQASVADDQLAEVGRLLGRAADILLLHSEDVDPPRSEALLRGVSLNDVPPLVVHVPTERRAVNRALKNLRPTDVLYVLADDPAPVLRAIARAGDTVRVAGRTVGA